MGIIITTQKGARASCHSVSIRPECETLTPDTPPYQFLRVTMCNVNGEYIMLLWVSFYCV